MKILSLDQARLCGYAVGPTGSKPRAELLNMGKSGTPSGEFLWRWSQALKELFTRHEPDLIAYEAPFFSKKTATSGTRLLQMEAPILIIAYGMRIRTMRVHNGSWKASFCGKANFNKDTVPYPPILECEQRGIEIDGDNNLADAVGIWHHAALIEDPKAMANIDTPLFARV